MPHCLLRDGFLAAFDAIPLVAILRGIRPDEADDVGEALVQAGIRVIEVPMNSPEPATSIARLARRLAGRAVVGAGTVVTPQLLDEAAAAGAAFIVAPNVDRAIVAETRARGLGSLPGVFTPTEAFAALEAGADALKLFPAEAANPKVVGALKAVLPPKTRLVIVGGMDEGSMAPWKRAGADGVGFGSSLYKPGRGAADVGARARHLLAAWSAA